MKCKGKPRILKTSIEMPLSVSKQIDNLIDKYDNSKHSTKQSFMLSAIIEKIENCYGENKETSLELPLESKEDNSKSPVENTEDNSKFLQEWRKRNG